MTRAKISLIEQRVIEAQAIVPLIIAFGEKVGLEQAIAIVQRNNEETSREYGRRCAANLGSNSMSDLISEVASWGEGGVLEEVVLERDERTYAFNVTGCLYAERYDALGVREFGYCLSCCRDNPFVEGFNPKIKFKRTQTIMEGAPYCDFRYTLED
ncbi:MAG: L-2-amino-thiazoline-4-carboxylic acid hydrolase [Desulfobacterales bacterium]|nr:MAG: L-2-amino-thiazoline-4-carboxylic acid hydrolase [Desulfobacterales bacterium]